jgi:sec-independent protein translocase protein TatA
LSIIKNQHVKISARISEVIGWSGKRPEKFDRNLAQSLVNSPANGNISFLLISAGKFRRKHMIGFKELLVILLIVIILFGANRLPRIMGDIGKGVRSLRDGLKGEENEQAAADKPAAPKSLPASSAQENTVTPREDSKIS